ncbi:MAG: hypothetical protein QM278_01625 [Pseudomonadota bacterium]|nr:hypothetical protein [Pseudomonadota bacterium]
MKRTSALLNLMLVMAIVVAAFPAGNRALDLNRDNRIDLGETIIQIRHFARSAEHPDRFAPSLENALTALQVAAGLKQAISSKDSPQASPQQHFLLVYLAPTGQLTAPMDAHPNIDKTDRKPTSVASRPETPPPRFA